MKVFVSQSQDSLNALRLSAAWIVLWSHSYVLTGEPEDPLLKSLGLSGGHVAVDVFFFISGLLIAGSIDRGTPWPVFLKNRALRIFPGLWVMLLVTCSLYLLLSVLNGDTAPWTSLVRYLQRNGALVSSELEYSLGTLFHDNPYPKVVNGSLWTLPWELRMYALLGLSGYLLHSVRRYAYALLAITGWAIWHFGPLFGSAGLLAYADPWRFLYFFFFGALMSRTAELDGGVGIWARKWWPVMSLAVVASVATVAPRFAVFAYGATLPAFVVGIGYGWVSSNAVTNVVKSNDLSYGMYLYAFPIQQSIVAFFPHLPPSALTFTATVPTIAIAWLSWRFIERPALALKGTRRLAKRDSH